MTEMVYGAMFTVCGTLGDVDDVTEGFNTRGIKLELPPQSVSVCTPIIVRCIAPDKETHEWMMKRLQDNDKVGASYPFFNDMETRGPARSSATIPDIVKEIIDKEVEKLRKEGKWGWF